MFGAIATGGVVCGSVKEGCTMKEVILELIEQGRYAEVRNKIAEMNEVDIAQILEETDKHKLLVIFRILPKDVAAGVFSVYIV